MTHRQLVGRAITGRDRLQEGIFFRHEQSAPPYLLLLFLNVRSGTKPAEAASAVADIVEVLRALKENGGVRDLQPGRKGEPAVNVPSRTFTSLLGYGARFFDQTRHRPRLTKADRPAFLAYLARPNSAFATLPWARAAGDATSGETDLCLQFNGLSEVAVNRAAVEVWKAIVDRDLPLKIMGSYSGFQRDDGRSLIDFHDGVSNIEPSQRLAALEADADPPWNAGGTYMAFLRLVVDLAAWRELPREQQEVIVGRDKLTGCPLQGVGREDGRLVPKTFPGCPLTKKSTDLEQASYRDPPQTGDRLVEASHIHRTNQNRAAPTTPAGQRIFRQGYEFLESFSDRGPRLGLNFISFQKDLQRLQQILGLSGWLGDVNFGGPAHPQPGDPRPLLLMQLLAGGFYAVPPRAQPFPGAELFQID